MKTDKQELRKEGWEEHWEIVNNQIKEGVNPHAYRLGFLACSKQLEAKDKEIEELKAAIRASERFRITDAGSAISEANELRQKIKDQELIIYGLEEGAGQWESLCHDKEKQITDLKAELKESNKL